MPKDERNSSVWVEPPKVKKTEVSALRLIVVVAALSGLLIAASTWFKDVPPPVIPRHLDSIKVIVHKNTSRDVKGYSVKR